LKAEKAHKRANKLLCQDVKVVQILCQDCNCEQEKALHLQSL